MEFDDSILYETKFVKPEKLSLFNNRIEIQKAREYKSQDSQVLGSTLNQRGKIFSEEPRDPPQQEAAAAGASYHVLLDYKGNVVELSRRCEMKAGMQAFGTAPKFLEKPAKVRINTTAMNRVMDNTHEVPPIKDPMVYENLKWSETERWHHDTDDRLGPGYYDVTAFERGKYGPPLHCTKFAGGADPDAPSVLLSLPPGAPIPLTLASTLRRKFKGQLLAEQQRELEEKEKLDNRDSGINDDQGPASPSSLADFADVNRVKGTIKWSDGDRWKGGGEIKPEPYVKTSGMILDQDWDKRVFDSRKIIPKFGTGPRYPKERPKDGANVDIDVDKFPPPKNSLQMSSKYSPIKYSAAFISNAPVGCPVTLPTSGTLGPGNYDSFKPAIEIKNPDKPSLAFLCKKLNLKEDNGGFESVEELPKFSDIHTKGPKFPLAVKSTGRNDHVLQFTKKKMEKIYPKLAKKKFKNYVPP